MLLLAVGGHAMWKSVALVLVGVALCSCSPAERHHERGAACVARGDWDGAIKAFSRAIGSNPSRAEAYHGRAGAYYRKGDLDHAVQDYTRAIELKPDYAVAFYNRGYLRSLRSDWDHAIADYSRAIELQSDYALAYCSRGNAYGHKRDWDQAVRDCTRAIELSPDLAQAYHGRGRAHFELGNWDRAVADLAKALDTAPDDPAACACLAYMLATCPKDSVRDGRRALEYAQKACALTGQDASCLVALAAACADMGRYDEAITWQRLALDDPSYLEAGREKALARLKLYREGKPYRESAPLPPAAPPAATTVK